MAYWYKCPYFRSICIRPFQNQINLEVCFRRWTFLKFKNSMKIAMTVTISMIENHFVWIFFKFEPEIHPNQKMWRPFSCTPGAADILESHSSLVVQLVQQDKGERIKTHKFHQFVDEVYLPVLRFGSSINPINYDLLLYKKSLDGLG